MPQPNSYCRGWVCPALGHPKGCPQKRSGRRPSWIPAGDTSNSRGQRPRKACQQKGLTLKRSNPGNVPAVMGYSLRGNATPLVSGAEPHVFRQRCPRLLSCAFSGGKNVAFEENGAPLVLSLHAYFSTRAGSAELFLSCMLPESILECVRSYLLVDPPFRRRAASPRGPAHHGSNQRSWTMKRHRHQTPSEIRAVGAEFSTRSAPSRNSRIGTAINSIANCWSCFKKSKMKS